MKKASKLFRIVFVRHGESIWNKENRFTGWTDVALTEKGIQEARKAGQVLAKEGMKFDLAFTSVLRRAVHTYNLMCEEMDTFHVPVIRSWRLNERHYGALQGLNKKETAEKHGEDQVLVWRRSFDIPPPDLDIEDPRYPGNDPKFAKIPRGVLPRTESLKTTIDRVLPFWYDHICPAMLAGENVIVAAHGNSLRAIIKHVKNINEKGRLFNEP